MHDCRQHLADFPKKRIRPNVVTYTAAEKALYLEWMGGLMDGSCIGWLAGGLTGKRAFVGLCARAKR